MHVLNDSDESSNARTTRNYSAKSHVWRNHTYFKGNARTSFIVPFSVQIMRNIFRKRTFPKSKSLGPQNHHHSHIQPELFWVRRLVRSGFVFEGFWA